MHHLSALRRRGTDFRMKQHQRDDGLSLDAYDAFGVSRAPRVCRLRAQRAA